MQGKKRLIDWRCKFFTCFTLSFLTSSVVRRLQKSRYQYFVGKKTVPLKKEMGALKSQSQLRSTSRSLQWSQVYLAPRSHPWHSPSFHPRHRGWNVMKVNCSQPPFAASVRRCPGLLSSFQSLSLFSSQAVLSKSPFGCAKVYMCVCVCENVCMHVCVCWTKVLFSQSFLMPVGRELPRLGVCGAVWQLQFIQTWAWRDKGEKSHYKLQTFT